MTEKINFRPLHALTEHEWNAHNVRRFFWCVLALLESWLGWGCTVWRNTYNVHTNQGANNANGALVGVVIFGVIFVALSICMLWKWENRQPPRKTKRDLEQRIAELEAEVLVDV